MIKLRSLAGTALALAALLAACGVQNVPIEADLGVADHTVVYDGEPQRPEITFDPPGAEIGAEVVVAPVGGAPLESGTWPTDAGVYAVSVRASAAHGGREATGTLTIAPRPIDVAPLAGQGKVFGAAEPGLAYAFLDPAGEGIVPTSATGALAREAGEALGTYAFTLGDLDAGGNFALALAEGSASFAIAASELGAGGVVVSSATVVFDGAGHEVAVAFDPPEAAIGAVVTYGDLEPGARPVDAGAYAVTATAGAGYVGTASGTLVVLPRPIDVVPVLGQGKLFGAPDPVLAYDFVDPAGDGVVPATTSGGLGREAGEALGTYAFTLGDVDAGGNFALGLPVGAPDFTIAARELGDGGIVVDDATVVFDGTARSLPVAFDPPAAGEGAVVTYGDLEPGALPVDAGTYAVEVVAAPGYLGGATATLTILPRPVQVVPSPDQGKAYGATEPSYGFAFADPSGDGVVPSASTGALARAAGEHVGSYAFELGTLANPNYLLSLAADAPAFAIAARPITLHATEDRRDYALADPDLTAVLAERTTLRDGDALTGALAHDGTSVGTYPLSIGGTAIVRGDVDVSGNYAIALGSFTIDPLPVAFDVVNPDFVLGEGAERVHGFYGDGATPVRGLEVAVAPDGATPTFRFTYRWTHDANHAAFPSPVTVQRIQGLGTYQVTITATAGDPNYVGSTTLTVWVTDAVGLTFAQPAYEALVGATATTQVVLVDAAGAPRAAGPAPIVVDLSSDAATADFGVGERFAASARATVASGATGADVVLRAVALGGAPANLTATLVGATGTALVDGAATFASTASLVFAPASVQVGADALSPAVAVRLVGFGGQPVAAPSDLQLALASDPVGLTFRDAGDAVDLTALTIAAGASEAGYRLFGATAGAFAATASAGRAIAGVAAGELAVLITPKPVVGAIAPSAAAKAQTLDLVLTGTGFAPGATVAFSGDDVTVNAVTVDGPTQLTVDATLSASTATGSRDVTVANADGGTSTTEAALTLTVPALTANDDGPYGVVEGGNRVLSIAGDLLANDTWSGRTAWGFDGVQSASGVTYAVSGDVLTVSAAADTGGNAASLTYRVRDDVFGTTATATVAIDVTLAPVEAILFTDPLEFQDFRTTEYRVPTFADVFASWPRFDGASYFTSSPYSTNAGAWYLEGGTVVQPNNVSPGVGFVSPDAFEYFTLEATLYSGNSDDDSVGLVAAFGRPDGSNVGLVAHRTSGGNSPYDGWGLSLLQGSSYLVLAEPTVDAFTAPGGWTGRASRVRVERIGDIVRIQATDWFSSDVATATPAYDPQSRITIDLATGVVTYRSGSAFVDVTLPSTQRTAVASLRGPRSYGYYTYSQPDSRYYNIAFEGGAAADTAILLTDFDAGLGAYTGSQVWRFTEGWTQVAGRTIQQELGAPRDVSSVAKPNPGSAYPGGYAAFGDRFRIESATVVPLVD